MVKNISGKGNGCMNMHKLLLFYVACWCSLFIQERRYRTQPASTYQLFYDKLNTVCEYLMCTFASTGALLKVERHTLLFLLLSQRTLIYWSQSLTETLCSNWFTTVLCYYVCTYQPSQYKQKSNPSNLNKILTVCYKNIPVLL